MQGDVRREPKRGLNGKFIRDLKREELQGAFQETFKENSFQSLCTPLD